ncbi:tetratricopeptide repeat protein [Streptomyces sp. NPDC001296]
MVTFEQSDPSAPNLGLERAAQFGDCQAMLHLAFFAERDPERAEQWLHAAADTGDSSAMYGLAELLSARQSDQAQHWYHRAADAGHPPAMYLMSAISDDAQEREKWLRHAAQSGHLRAGVELARPLLNRGLHQEAEYWLRAATGAGKTRRTEPLRWRETRADLRLLQQACLDLADLLDAQDRVEEAGEWRNRAKRADRRAGSHSRMGGLADAMVTTAVVTTAVVPFVQALVSKAADDAYGQARALIRRMMRHTPAPPETAHTLLIVDDTDAQITLCLWSDVTDEALRALASLNLDELTAQRPDRGQIRLVWNPAQARWRIRGAETDR